MLTGLVWVADLAAYSMDAGGTVNVLYKGQAAAAALNVTLPPPLSSY